MWTFCILGGGFVKILNQIVSIKVNVFSNTVAAVLPACGRLDRISLKGFCVNEITTV